MVIISLVASQGVPYGNAVALGVNAVNRIPHTKYTRCQGAHPIARWERAPPAPQTPAMRLLAGGFLVEVPYGARDDGPRLLYTFPIPGLPHVATSRSCRFTTRRRRLRRRNGRICRRSGPGSPGHLSRSEASRVAATTSAFHTRRRER